MAHENIDERRFQVMSLIKSGQMSNRHAKLISERFETTYSSVKSDWAFLTRENDLPLYPGRSLKKKVFARDNFICQYCELKKEYLVAEHVIPVYQHGVGVEYNMVTACYSCNAKKKSKVWIPKNIETLRKINSDWANRIESLAVPY